MSHCVRVPAISDADHRNMIADLFPSRVSHSTRTSQMLQSEQSVPTISPLLTIRNKNPDREREQQPLSAVSYEVSAKQCLTSSSHFGPDVDRHLLLLCSHIISTYYILISHLTHCKQRNIRVKMKICHLFSASSFLVSHFLLHQSPCDWTCRAAAVAEGFPEDCVSVREKVDLTLSRFTCFRGK
jgi:hypothetical protein